MYIYDIYVIYIIYIFKLSIYILFYICDIFNSMVYVHIPCIVDVVLWEYVGSTWKSDA